MNHANDVKAKIDSARQAALNVARGMLDGSIPLIDGCRQLVRLRRDAEIPPTEAFNVFVSVESDTDDYPLGNLRAEYAPELLARLDAKVSRILANDTPIIMDACREFIREIESLRFGSCEGSVQ